MAGNLRDRLKRIQQTKQKTARITQYDSGDAGCSFFTGKGWVSAGHLTLRREICGDTVTLPHAMPDAAGIVMPGIKPGAAYGDLLFFDLETTGLSTGAGTIAFLAAFGRLHVGKAKGWPARCQLRITQYLLLDYPGESDFIEALLGEFNRAAKNSDNLTMISYNGKCFDSQILKIRCLMNGITLPEYLHADLLHPARRLWKNLLPDCSQATIETGIFGIDRAGDIPGAMAPEIWFSFLRHGETEPLLGICDHNRRDIAGLAAIFAAMVHIAEDPVKAIQKINFDPETLAIRWYDSQHNMGERFLRYAAEKDYPKAELHYGLVLFKAKRFEEGRKWLLKTAGGGNPQLQTAALRALAIDSERRVKDAAEALELALRGMELLPPSPRRDEFERRVQRLESKMNNLS